MKKFIILLFIATLSFSSFAQKSTVKSLNIFGIEIGHAGLSFIGTVSTISPELAGDKYSKTVNKIGFGLIILGMVLESGYIKAATPEQENFIQNLNFEAEMAKSNPDLVGNLSIGLAARKFDYNDQNLTDEDKISIFSSIMVNVANKVSDLVISGRTVITEEEAIALLQGEESESNLVAVKNRLYLSGISVEENSNDLQGSNESRDGLKSSLPTNIGAPQTSTAVEVIKG